MNLFALLEKADRDNELARAEQADWDARRALQEGAEMLTHRSCWLFLAGNKDAAAVLAEQAVDMLREAQ